MQKFIYAGIAAIGAFLIADSFTKSEEKPDDVSSETPPEKETEIPPAE